MGHSGFYTSYLPPPQAAFQIVGSLEYNVQPVNFPLTPELEDLECLVRYLNIAAVCFWMRCPHLGPGPGHSISGKDSEVRD